MVNLERRTSKRHEKLIAVANWDVVANCRTCVDLAGAADSLRWRTMHLDPVSDPAGQAAKGKQNGEHLLWNANRSVDDARVEVDVRVKFLLDEVGIVQSNFFEFLCNLEQRIV